VIALAAAVLAGYALVGDLEQLQSCVLELSR
jgi:hypothetical protein